MPTTLVKLWAFDHWQWKGKEHWQTSIPVQLVGVRQRWGYIKYLRCQPIFQVITKIALPWQSLGLLTEMQCRDFLLKNSCASWLTRRQNVHSCQWHCPKISVQDSRAYNFKLVNMFAHETSNNAHRRGCTGAGSRESESFPASLKWDDRLHRKTVAWEEKIERIRLH